MPELESIIRRLTALGHRTTPSRAAVIAAVLAQGGHFSIDDVLRTARNVGRATVFRTMRLLTDLDILCRVLLEDGSLHYRVSRRGDHHHHLVCVSCGNVRDLEDCAVSDLVRDLAAATNYDIEGHWLEFYGRCASCRSPMAAGP
ncbi:MAG: transcriptional repressor [Dehalococcoidia bacterium]|nr:MAG: transcriptional repressor [Dehalococcoidia bacterium]